MTATLLRTNPAYAAQDEGGLPSLYRRIEATIVGNDTMLLHNGMLASPLNPVTKAMKQITAKKTKKTERDVEMLSELEVVGGVYVARRMADGSAGSVCTVQLEMGEVDFNFGLNAVNEDGSENRNLPLEDIRADQIVMPGLNLEALLVKGAKKSRLGTDFKTGVMVPGNYWIRHQHENEMLKNLINAPEFIDSRLVVVDRKRIVRSRPRLSRWSVSFSIDYIPSVVNASQVRKALDDAALYVGLGDFAPRFGKFQVSSWVEQG